MWSFHIANCHMDKAMYRHTSFHCTSFHCALQILGFFFLYKLKTCDNPTSSKSMHTIHTIFPIVHSFHVSVSHFGNYQKVSNFLIIILFVAMTCAR